MSSVPVIGPPHNWDTPDARGMADLRSKVRARDGIWIACSGASSSGPSIHGPSVGVAGWLCDGIFFATGCIEHAIAPFGNDEPGAVIGRDHKGNVASLAQRYTWRKARRRLGVATPRPGVFEIPPSLPLKGVAGEGTHPTSRTHVLTDDPSGPE